MKPRNFGNLGGTTAAALNAGTIGIQKDKVVYLDPNAEILYDPAENIRNGKVVDDDIEGLVELRMTMDGAEQLQPIRVYPLPPEKLDPTKPAMKYGIGYGHRRTLSCRLTKADHPSVGDKPRKVMAVIDVDWLKRGRAYRLRCQIHENTSRAALNPVEFGQALLDYQRELSEEEKRHVSQLELMHVFGLREKTVYALLKAAEFHPFAKEICHRKLLSDLDTMVTFDSICKLNEDLAQAIFTSLQVEGAPSNRSLIRQAKALAEDENYKFNADTWVWPDSVATVPVQKPAALPEKPPVQAPSADAPGGAVPPQSSALNGGNKSQDGEGAGAQGAGSGGQSSSAPQVSPAEPESQAPGQAATTLNTQAPAAPGAAAPQQSEHQLNESRQQESQAKGPVIMVEFKMGTEANKLFTGELLISRKAKATSSGVVAYLNDEGREEFVEVPLKHIGLVSINHQ